jgi:Rieske Fe-S protein
MSDEFLPSTSNDQPVSRRDFLKTCVGISCAAGLVSMLGGCASEYGEDVPAGTSAVPVAATANADGTFTVAGAGRPGDKAVYFTLPENRPGVVFASGGRLRAFSTKCPHAGCAVTREGNGFKCPCHSSQFSGEGKPLSGPAKSPLVEYSVSVRGEDAVVKIAL